jgi:beta-N-acetylhexosaminidase
MRERWAGSKRGVRYGASAAAAAVALAVSLVATASVTARPARGQGLEGLSTRQLAGQRVIYSYPGPTPPPQLFDIIRRGEAAGVIFFRENITSPEQIRGVVEQFQQANQTSPVRAPLLMMTDQEGGRVRRIRPGEPELSEKQIGEQASVRRCTSPDALPARH